MSNSNKEYWIKRITSRDKASRLKEDKLLKELYKAYSESYIAIQKELNDFYVKYASENELSYASVKRMLKPTDMKQYNSKMNELKKLYKSNGSEEVFIEMEKLGARANITRLQSLLDAVDVELIKNTYDTQIKLEEHLAGMYKRSYKEALEDVGMSNKVINDRAVKETLSYPWSGRNFSERIWGNKAATLNLFKETISKGIIQGQSIQDMAQNIMSKEKVSKYNVERLVRTETNFFMTKGHIDGYKESGVVQELQVDAYIDGRTCSRCRSKDETTVKLDEAIYGDNVSPFHPSCRCTVVPIVDNNEKDQRN